MHPQADGWFVLQDARARVGDLYQFLVDGNIFVPDPASRYQAEDIHGPSVVCDPLAYTWRDQDWPGRSWEETVIYELHIGTFSDQGTFAGVRRRLDDLRDLGITAIELMPIAHFPGRCNWGYDGTLLFAPYNRYGTPDDFKELVQAAHLKGLMVFLDVVYNHFGPEGNYLYVYARDAFYTEEYHTPWGDAVRFSGPQSRTVRDFFIANALYWLEEFHLDGLRVDAAHAIFDPSEPDILEEIALAIKDGPGRKRNIHLIIENDDNRSRYLERAADGSPRLFTAQWNDDMHHAIHVLLTDETDGYYSDYGDRPIRHLGRCLTEGFAYQGEVSAFRSGSPRGDPSGHLPPLAFVSFLQNHDQIGNRAFGERLTTLCDVHELRICIALLMLAPQPPLLFMGEEYGSTNPFCYFCDFEPGLAEKVTAGRRQEFSAFDRFSSAESRERIPDPGAEATFLRSKLDWCDRTVKEHGDYLKLYQKLLKIREKEIVPRLKSMTSDRAGYCLLGDRALQAWWKMGDGSALTVQFNLHHHTIPLPSSQSVARRVLFKMVMQEGDTDTLHDDELQPLAIIWSLQDEGETNG